MIKKYTKNRERLVQLINGTNGLIAISDAEQILGLPREDARKALWSMTKSGWIKSIKSGLYSVVTLETTDPSLSDKNPSLIANALFKECYIGGWSAANFWGFTDQIFLDTWVMTTQIVRQKKRTIGANKFILRQIKSDYFFGLKTEWVQNNKVMISDPSKTVIDFLNFAENFTASSMIDIFKSYINSDYKDFTILQEYAVRSSNKTIFKRLGFLIEKFLPEEKEIISFCQNNISKGYSSLSILSSNKNIIAKWNLRIPANLKEAKSND
jgi:predicted transcriptional regulator of viral defense system